MPKYLEFSTPVWDGLGPNSSTWHYFHRKMQAKFQNQVSAHTPLAELGDCAESEPEGQRAFCNPSDRLGNLAPLF